MQHFDKREMGIRIKELRKRQDLTGDGRDTREFDS